MMKFGAFENTVQLLYRTVVPKPKSECTKTEQLGVSFLAGYIAGVLCAVVSQPADNLVSKLNSQKGSTVGDIVREMGWYNLFTRGRPCKGGRAGSEEELTRALGQTGQTVLK